MKILRKDIIELLMTYGEGHLDVAIAGVYLPDYPNTISFFKTPKELYSYVEENIGEIIAHEQIHLALFEIEGMDATRGWDKIFNDDREQKIQFCKEMLK